jgi:alpha-tubulin suppressor-like RCC1 family protein
LRKICIGKNHSIALFESGKISVLGDNHNGQLGIPFKKTCEGNKFDEWYTFSPEIDTLKNSSVIDIACGDDFSLLLISENQQNILVRLGYKQEDKYRDNIEDISPIVNLKENLINMFFIFYFLLLIIHYLFFIFYFL